MNNTHLKGYSAVHQWNRRHLGLPKECESCGKNDPNSRYEWANISEKYLRVKSDWIRLCVKCHRLKDQAWKKVAVFKKPKGVYKHKFGGWYSRIQVNNKDIYLGYFKTREQAEKSYQIEFRKVYKKHI